MLDVTSRKFEREVKSRRLLDTSMTISYNKLWKLLIDKKLSKADLRKNADIAPNTMTKLRRDEPVSMLILLKIAEYLDCDISDMCEFIKEEK